VSARTEEPSIPQKLQRPLAALWISLGLHGALIALVQVAPQPQPGGETVIEARLENVPQETVPVPVLTPAIKTVDTVGITVSAHTPSPVAEELPSPEPTPLAPGPRTEPATQTLVEPQGPRLEIPVAVDLTYYSAREVDVHPRALYPIEPDYPEEAERQRLSGSVRLRLKLEESGQVSEIEVVEANPPGFFDESAREAFRNARFSPAQKNGRPVRALVIIEVKYDYEGRLVPGASQQENLGQ
jgi:periplasmic protein TonB